VTALQDRRRPTKEKDWKQKFQKKPTLELCLVSSGYTILLLCILPIISRFSFSVFFRMVFLVFRFSSCHLLFSALCPGQL